MARLRHPGKFADRRARPKVVAFLGHFDATNLGNEATLRAVYDRLRSAEPNVEFVCISTNRRPPVAVPMDCIPISGTFATSLPSRNAFVRLLERLCRRIPSEFYRWFSALLVARCIDVFVVPGTGLLTDTWGLCAFGPYNVFKWALLAKLNGRKLIFASVGAGPLYGVAGRWLVRAALWCADFRSYRDVSTRECLGRTGLDVTGDPIYPDLAFGLSNATAVDRDRRTGRNGGRPVVGLGLMADAGRYRTADPHAETHRHYLDSLAGLAAWLVANGYDVRLLIGDISEDRNVTGEFRALLAKILPPQHADRVVDEPIDSFEGLLSQIAKTDLVVATRFHNVVLALLRNKPTISISFHHKCESLMRAMGLTDYCLDIDGLTAEMLVERFRDLAANAVELKARIGARTSEYRRVLDDQYRVIADLMAMRSAEPDGCPVVSSRGG